MRLNKFLAERLGLARRKADALVESGRVTIDGKTAEAGTQVTPAMVVAVDGKRVESGPSQAATLIALHKPAGYVCSRDGQGSKTVYELLPVVLHQLNPIGRLDKDSTGLLLLTNDGKLTYELTHPKFEKEKVYQVRLSRPLLTEDRKRLEQGIQLEDGPSRVTLKPLAAPKAPGTAWEVRLHEGRNRQIRRSFTAAGYEVTALHRTHFGPYKLGSLASGKFLKIL